MTFPQIDPVLFSLGPLQVRWYGLMYVLGFTASYFLVLKQIKEFRFGSFATRPGQQQVRRGPRFIVIVGNSYAS